MEFDSRVRDKEMNGQSSWRILYDKNQSPALKAGSKELIRRSLAEGTCTTNRAHPTVTKSLNHPEDPTLWSELVLDASGNCMQPTPEQRFGKNYL